MENILKWSIGVKIVQETQFNQKSWWNLDLLQSNVFDQILMIFVTTQKSDELNIIAIINPYFLCDLGTRRAQQKYFLQKFQIFPYEKKLKLKKQFDYNTNVYFIFMLTE